MAGNATDWLESKVIQHVLGLAAMGMPAIFYVGLCTTMPDDATPGTEVIGAGYSRMPVYFAMVAGSEAANTATLQWATAAAAWGTVGWVELWDASSGGNRYFWLPLVDPVDMTTPKPVTIAAGDIMRIPANQLIVTAD